MKSGATAVTAATASCSMWPITTIAEAANAATAAAHQHLACRKPSRRNAADRAATIIGAVDQESSHVGRAHFGKGDFWGRSCMAHLH
jgi:hypothetical protein